jgi:hypothetical protein
MTGYKQAQTNHSIHDREFGVRKAHDCSILLEWKVDLANVCVVVAIVST